MVNSKIELTIKINRLNEISRKQGNSAKGSSMDI